MVTGLIPFTQSCTISRFMNVVFPEEDGPAIHTIRIPGRLNAIESASQASFFSCNASAMEISRNAFPSSMA